MIEREQQPCYLVRCDECKETYGGDEFAAMHFESEAEAREQLRYAEWEIDEAGRVLCAGCIEERDA